MKASDLRSEIQAELVVVQTRLKTANDVQAVRTARIQLAGVYRKMVNLESAVRAEERTK